jgi:hypothetical protein
VLALAVALAWLGLSAEPVQGQAEVGPTPTPTPTLEGPEDQPTHFGPTPTVTPTLLPPPPGGGRVAVSALAVRVAPSPDRIALGQLRYGVEVFPVARSYDANWVVIRYGGRDAWIFAPLVEWQADISQLPVWPESPAETGTQITPTPLSPPPASETPTPSATVRAVPTLTHTPTVAALVAGSGEETVPSPVASLPVSAGGSGGGAALWLVRVGGLAIVAGLLSLYIWRYSAGVRDARRFQGGFMVSRCPACRQGNLSLDEYVTRAFGIPRVRRAVRCDTCRSVLREVKRDLWRYTVDPAVDEAFAQEYNGQLLDEQELVRIVRARVGKGASRA